MFSSLKILTCTALTMSLLSAPAFAADFNAQGAAALKTLIESQMDLKQTEQKAAGGSYIIQGQVKVEPAGTYYAVTFPHTKIKDASGMVYDIGMIAANVVPGATASEWKAAIAIPTPIKIQDDKGAPAGHVDIQKQKAMGVWDTSLNAFRTLDSSYDGLSFKDAKNTETVTIDFLSLVYSLTGSKTTPVDASAHVKYMGLTDVAKKMDTDVLPRNLDVELNVKKIAFADLVKASRSLMTSDILKALSELPQYLTDGSSLSHSLEVTSPAYAGKGNGTITANKNAAQFYTADQYLQIEGLDAIVLKVNEQIAKSSTAKAEALQKTLGPLTIMQMVGRKDGANPDLRTYKFSLNQSGQMMLNGADMSMLLGAAAVPSVLRAQ
jgi:hypothetical protein